MKIRRLFPFWCMVASAWSAVQPAGIFSDHAVLQQGERVRIWGTAAPGEHVTVFFAGQSPQAVADAEGDWLVTLDALAVCAEGRPLIFQGSETPKPVELRDVVVGEVWLAGGQSNMQTPMSFYKATTQADMDGANDSLLRVATIPIKGYAGANTRLPEWQLTGPQTVGQFSATAWYFARDLRSVLGVPVGVVVCAVGGTPAEAWMDRETLADDPLTRRVLENYDRIFRAKFPTDEAYRKYCEEDYPQLVKAFRLKKSEGGSPNPPPVWEMGPRNVQRPSGLYETMLKQVIPYTVRGVIWYQGENNANEHVGWHYRRVFSTLIGKWRKDFQNPEMPFLFVQLATLGKKGDADPFWPELRESQRLVEKEVPHTGMAVLVDGGELDNIHPHSKDKAGCRLSFLARNLVYGETGLICRGPQLKGKTCRGDRIELTLDPAGSELVLHPDAAGAWEICGEDGRFLPAEAVQEEGKIFVFSRDVPSPRDVRYGWRKWFVPVLFNRAGLPAAPFRTDDQPMKTEGIVYLDERLRRGVPPPGGEQATNGD